MNEEKCSICLGDLRDPDMEVYETKCGHKFHKDCLLNYCTISNPDRDLNHVGISCPLCNTGLNCRFNGGVDIFPEILNNDNANTNNMETHIVQPPSNFDRALSLIPKGEYELIDTVDDINIPQIPNLTLEEKKLILAEILRKREAGEGEESEGGKRKTKRNKSKRRKETNKKRNKLKRRKQTNKKRNKSKRRKQTKKEFK
jgi:hypothetical protein